METALYSILNTPSFCGGGGGGGSRDTIKLSYHMFGNKICSNSTRFSSKICHCYSVGRKIETLDFDRLIINASSRNSAENNTSRKPFFLKLKGGRQTYITGTASHIYLKTLVLIDLNRSGNCQAFNAAFKKLGLDCVNWTKPVYSDLASLQNVVAAPRAGAEYVEVPVEKCLLVAGNISGVSVGAQIGMPCVVLRSSSTARAEFSTAMAVIDGFGGADLTISRLCKKLSS